MTELNIANLSDFLNEVVGEDNFDFENAYKNFTTQTVPEGITAHIFEDADKNEWVLFASSPLTANNVSPEMAENITPEHAETMRQRQVAKGELFGFTLTDRVYTVPEGGLEFTPTRSVQNPNVNMIEMLMYHISDVEYAMQLTSAVK